MSELQLARIQAGSDGWDPESATEYVGPTKAATLTNFLPARNGKIVPRGGLSLSASLAASTAADNNLWTHDDKVIVKPSGTTVRSATLSDGAISSVTTTTHASVASEALDRSYARVGDYTFGALVGNKVARYAPTSDLVVLLTNSPAAMVRACAAHLERLFVLADDSTVLYWTDPGGPGSADTADLWQDDVSGLTNQINLVGGESRDLVRMGSNLAIFTNDTVQVLTGSSPATFAVRQISDLGMLHHNVGLPWDDGVVYTTRDGIVWIDGSGSPRNLSRPIQSQWHSLGGTRADGQVKVSLARWGSEFMAVCVQDLFSSQYSLLACHMPSLAWTRLTTASGTVPRLVKQTAEHSVLFDGQYAWNADAVTAPERPLVTSVDTSVAGVGSLPAVSFESKVHRLATPGNKAHLKRFMLDYVLGRETSSGTAPVFTASLVGHDGTVLYSTTLNVNTGSTYRDRQRKVADIPGEAETVQLRISASATTATYSDYEFAVEDCTVEYQTSRQRTG